MLPNGINTYTGLIIAILPVILGLLGITPTPAFNAELPELVAAIVQVIGLAYAAYGRARIVTPK